MLLLVATSLSSQKVTQLALSRPRSRRETFSRSYAMDCSICCLHHQPIPHSSGWQDIVRADVQQGSLRSVGSFREKSSGSCSSHPPSQKLHLRARPQKHNSLWLEKWVITRTHIVAHEGQVLKTPTVTRLIKEQQLKSVEFSKIILPPHECEPDYQEPQEDRIALQELLRSLIMQQKSKMQNKDFKASSLWIKDLKSLLSTQAYHLRLHHPKERISNHHHCQRHQQSLLKSQGFRCLQDFTPCIFITLSNQAQLNLSSKLSNQINNQFRLEEESERNQPRENQQRFQQSFRTSRKIIFPSLRIRSMQIVKKLNQEEELLQGLILQEMVSRGSSGMFSRSDQRSYHRRAQADWTSRS